MSKPTPGIMRRVRRPLIRLVRPLRHSGRPFRRAGRPLVVTLATVALLLPKTGAVAGPTIGGTATLTASKAQVTFGGWVRLGGAVKAQEPCRSGREVRLRAVEADDGGQWSVIRTGHTDADGTFGFGVQPDHTAKYQAVLPKTPVCKLVASTALQVPVAVRVTLTGPTKPLPAGSCASLTAEVEPAKPGAPLRFQRLQGESWITVASPNLGGASRAGTKRCGGWSDIGTERWRARWTAADSGDKLNADGTSAPVTVQFVEATWMRHIEQLAGSHDMGIAVADGGTLLYEHDDAVAHIPASNEKLLQSMAVLDRVGPATTIATRVRVKSVSEGGVVPGNLWLVGRGDPEVTKRRLASLAAIVASAGITAVKGSVVGSTSYFDHDWFAPGWKPEFPAEEVALPTALTYMGNEVNGTHISHPERHAAAELTKMLRARGIAVEGTPGEGPEASGLHTVGQIVSAPIRTILRHQNFDSVNFDAEVLGKLLGVFVSGAPGTIDKGADAVGAFAAAHHVTVVTEDSSGLSYSDRATPIGIVRLLHVAEGASWGPALRASLPGPGHGTLEDRLAGIPVVAKTGTLEDVSALSGWVQLSRTGEWAAFSIMSGGFDVRDAKDIEDAIVTTLHKYAR